MNEKIDICNYDPIFIIFFVSISLISIFTSIIFYKKYKDEKTKNIAGFEGILTTKNMILLTENIHHELSTPLDVLFYNLNKIKSILTKKQKEKLKKEYDMINDSLNQIENILNRMKGFKELKYSNGNKTLYDIIKGSAEIIKVSRSENIEIIVDERFDNYKLKNLNNGDLLNILINHFKNSIEALASLIKVEIYKIEDDNLEFLIIDNGKGIPKEIQKDIFKQHFSSKDKTNVGTRGNGLYLNKFLLKSGGGDLSLFSTSPKGTIFKIKVKVKKA